LPLKRTPVEPRADFLGDFQGDFLCGFLGDLLAEVLTDRLAEVRDVSHSLA